MLPSTPDGHEEQPDEGEALLRWHRDDEQHEGDQADELGVRRHPVQRRGAVDVQVRRGPEPTSVLAPRRAAPQEEDEADHEQAGDGEPDEAREATGQPGVAHPGDCVAGQR